MGWLDDGVKAIAFYLPQFHPIPENDEWWGAGFTEWTNVAKARPRFRGHHQPHLPADLGFYDLRLPETRAAQARLAEQYGIHGFCYYHYWFSGRRLLERPFAEVLASGEPRLPFCLCWANENWTRNWSGEARLVLMPQAHGHQDDVDHIEWLCTAFADARYIKIAGRPLLLIYRVDIIPNVREMINLWRERAVRRGFPDLFLVAVKNDFVKLSCSALLELGFDGVCDFQPSAHAFSREPIRWWIRRKLGSLVNRVARRLGDDEAPGLLTVSEHRDYARLVDKAITAMRLHPERVFPTVMPSWDNSPRRRDGARIIQNDDPVPFERWVAACVQALESRPGGPRFLFINAWNEWGEGCHLEPDRRTGHSFLLALRRGLGAVG